LSLEHHALEKLIFLLFQQKKTEISGILIIQCILIVVSKSVSKFIKAFKQIAITVINIKILQLFSFALHVTFLNCFYQITFYNNYKLDTYTSRWNKIFVKRLPICRVRDNCILFKYTCRRNLPLEIYTSQQLQSLHALMCIGIVFFTCTVSFWKISLMFKVQQYIIRQFEIFLFKNWLIAILIY